MVSTYLSMRTASLREHSNAEYLIQERRRGVAGPVRRDPSETDNMPDKISPARGLILGISSGSLFWLVFVLVWTLGG